MSRFWVHMMELGQGMALSLRPNRGPSSLSPSQSSLAPTSCFPHGPVTCVLLTRLSLSQACGRCCVISQLYADQHAVWREDKGVRCFTCCRHSHREHRAKDQAQVDFLGHSNGGAGVLPRSPLSGRPGLVGPVP